MTKSELIESLYRKQPHLAYTDVDTAVRAIIDSMSSALELVNA